MGASKVKSQRLFAVAAAAVAASLFLTTVGAQQPVPQPAPQTTPAAPPPVRLGNLQLQNASLTEVIDQLARQLHLNYILDPAVKGTIVLNTYGDTANLDARNLL